ncbi:uncharacterized protein AMSG_10867 [Thecamonas trahens ATCC 50062]|uniref:Uncharacterized protein n=1 Tax=Thecamonas trahens ATCC 50062 TaxID=461836 RepID=A0A0L0DSI8_THETB|nr:hypothetical protein AMSG_10867 [Thecamonas trahens ATCC 50062]KNC55235.1 hypothetical protein AMSG_10867 [Thecamonas trahens ATCC 50062]|eukprot:XP_013753164.1 hypothetical protein AMSG_10867 [Thecamonas trahens ATCC 50062]
MPLASDWPSSDVSDAAGGGGGGGGGGDGDGGYHSSSELDGSDTSDVMSTGDSEDSYTPAPAPAPGLQHFGEQARMMFIEDVLASPAVPPTPPPEHYTPVARRSYRSSLTLRDNLAHWLRKSTLGHAMDTVQVLLSIIAAILYVVESYYTDGGRNRIPLGFLVIEIFLAAAFAVDFVIHFIASKSRLKFLVSPMSIVDLITILPVVVQLVLVNQVDLGFLRIVRILRVFRILRTYRLFSVTIDERKRELVVLLFTLVSLLYCSASLLQLFNDPGFAGTSPVIAWHDALYFVVVTFSTVGFGDVTPETPLGRFVTIGLIFITVILVPLQLSNLVAVFTKFKAHDRAYSGRYKRHILVTGTYTTAQLQDLLSELFCDDHPENDDIDVILLHPEEPSAETYNLIKSEAVEGRVTFLKGSVLHDQDLGRAALEDTEACFVLSSHYSALGIEDRKQADKQAILSSISLKSYNNKTRDVRVLTQLVSTANAALQESGAADYTLCPRELKFKCLLQGYRAPGVPALLSNILRSSDAFADNASSEPLWLREYCTGARVELYEITLPMSMRYLSFSRAFISMYFTYEVALLGIVIDDGTLVLAPGDSYVIAGGEQAVVLAEDFGSKHAAESGAAEQVRPFTRRPSLQDAIDMFTRGAPAGVVRSVQERSHHMARSPHASPHSRSSAAYVPSALTGASPPPQVSAPGSTRRKPLFPRDTHAMPSAPGRTSPQSNEDSPLADAALAGRGGANKGVNFRDDQARKANEEESKRAKDEQDEKARAPASAGSDATPKSKPDESAAGASAKSTQSTAGQDTAANGGRYKGKAEEPSTPSKATADGEKPTTSKDKARGKSKSKGKSKDKPATGHEQQEEEEEDGDDGRPSRSPASVDGTSLLWSSSSEEEAVANEVSPGHAISVVVDGPDPIATLAFVPPTASASDLDESGIELEVKVKPDRAGKSRGGSTGGESASADWVLNSDGKVQMLNASQTASVATPLVSTREAFLRKRNQSITVGIAQAAATLMHSSGSSEGNDDDGGLPTPIQTLQSAVQSEVVAEAVIEAATEAGKLQHPPDLESPPPGDALFPSLLVTGCISEIKMLLKEAARLGGMREFGRIALLSKGAMDSELEALMGLFAHCSFHRGVPTRPNDLARAGIRAASCVILLQGDEDADLGSTLVDADSLLSVMTIVNSFDAVAADVMPRLRTLLVDLAHFTNLKFLEPIMLESTFRNRMRVLPAFAAGSAFSTETLDPILPAAFFSDVVAMTVGQLLDVPVAPPIACRGSDDDSSEAEAADNDGRDSLIPRAFLYQISVPVQVWGLTYGHLVRLLVCEYHIVPLGLYRNGRHMDAPDDYVYTSPHEAVVLNPGDRAFVLARPSLLVGRFHVVSPVAVFW